MAHSSRLSCAAVAVRCQNGQQVSVTGALLASHGDGDRGAELLRLRRGSWWADWPAESLLIRVLTVSTTQPIKMVVTSGGRTVEWMASPVTNPASEPSALLRTPEFFRVGLLVPDDQDIRAISVGTRVSQALELMSAHDFDQLPVTTADNRVVGAFTYRSFAQGLRNLST